MGFEELKARQSVMWGSGPYERIAQTIAPMHDALVERLEPKRGERWLDVATGTGEVARRAARAGVEVTGVDLSPVLIETAERQTAEEGLSIRYDLGDAEALPYEDASFDVVCSSVGVMFAPDHAAAARELARVCRPGGRLGVTAWLESGGVGDLFRVMRPFQPPPAPGVGNQFDWGDEEYLSTLLGADFELDSEVLDAPHEPESAEAAWADFSTSYGPTKTLYDSLDPARREELKAAFLEHLRRWEKDGAISQPRLYRLTVGHRR